MRIDKHIIILLALCVLSLCAYADTRHYEQGEKIYLNANQGEMKWSKDGAHLFLYIWGSKGNDWVTLTNESGNIFVGDMPVGDWDKFIVVRKNNTTTTSGWDSNIWNRTCNLPFVNNPDINCINEFWIGVEDCDGSTNWATYAPSITKIGAFASVETEENIKVCPNALGGSLSLHPKLKADKSDYDYNNVKCHGWYVSTDKSTWVSVDGYAGNTRDGEKNQDASYVLPNSLSSGAIYFYLHSSKKAGRRLIKITADAQDCDLDCTITSFEIALSAVNANDTTYALDGMVAFGEPNGDLIITCDGQSTTIPASQAKSPQTFSIPNLRAITSGSKRMTVKAYFKGDEGKCSAQQSFDVPNATQGVVRTEKSVAIGDSIVIRPDGADFKHEHEWYIMDESGQWILLSTKGELTTTPRDEVRTDMYMYREFNPTPTNPGNMMDNGSYEVTDADYGTVGSTSTISDYNFWGKFKNASSQVDYYASNSGANNGFAVVQSANNFAPTYAKVTARDGSYFALFDAASGTEMAGKKAWYTNTAKSKNLKLQKGTTYLFSFWAVNINNYGEMDNAANLQFQINGQNLGKPLDLSSPEFRNNRWHQCSATYYAKADADNVTISVVNLNSNKLYTGNDFALDDIQFRAVSNNAKVVKAQQVFVVQTYNPCTEGRIFRKWDNVLFVNNGDSIYATYQWYKNGNILLGETLQRLYTGSTPMEGTTDLYHCVATRMDGTDEQFCAHTFNDFPESRKAAAVEDITLDGIAVWPTKIASGESVTVSKTSSGAVQATLLTLTGQTISTTILKENTNTIIMPAAAGLYLLRLQGANTQRTVKINVL
ncbi:MAG: T9SS type A sorting domain-containing protein [Paludibacteraceae bacterium]|nr:T9SS type A sorting domain-containing protein [Paludibacteraceae bacterium]